MDPRGFLAGNASALNPDTGTDTTPPMPVPDDKILQLMNERKLAKRSKGGRVSTVLTMGNNKLG